MRPQDGEGCFLKMYINVSYQNEPFGGVLKKKIHIFLKNIARLRNCPEVNKVNNGQQLSTKVTISSLVIGLVV